MTNITRIGVDLAKNIFQVCAVDRNGKVISNKTIKRAALKRYFAQISPCEIILEACSSANYWARVFSRYGHTVKLIHPAFVRPYVKTNKNDAADAQALCEAASRPTMRYVHPKTIEQQDIQLLHRAAERLVSSRTALANQTRSLLAEYGITLPQGIGHLRKQLPGILENAENELSHIARSTFNVLYQELVEMDEKLSTIKEHIKNMSKQTPLCQSLETIPGVGPMVATAIYCAMGDAKHFRNGREFAAFLGLVPKQYSTGGKSILRGISKRGDTRTRSLIVQGALAVLQHAHKKSDRLNCWASALKKRKGTQITAVALANKIARISWAVSAQQGKYKMVSI